MPYTIPRGVERLVVGTAYRPEAIQSILQRGFRSPTAELRREPDNAHDPNALAVWIDGRHAGYISAAMAKQYSPIIDKKLNGQPCLAHILSLSQDGQGEWLLHLDMAKPDAFWDKDSEQARYADEFRGPVTPIIGDWMDAALKAQEDSLQDAPETTPTAAPSAVSAPQEQPSPAESRKTPGRSNKRAAQVLKVIAIICLVIGLVGSVMNGAIIFLGLAWGCWELSKRQRTRWAEAVLDD
ncbi:HIRAN domain-containing protein [Rothia kristinae]|uniref:HIRAN domain-containing protein n=1 Tax=Rothia kristinae TaxID=37923 RepID=UPI0022E25AF6|nr:HIRAN domain-containing protein [Rothia kristinae]